MLERDFFKLDLSCKCLRYPVGLLQLWGFLFVLILHVVDPFSGLAYNIQG
jgi:hypothetical protein